MSHPNKKFKVILLGVGRVAQKHLKAIRLHASTFELIAAVDPHRAQAEATLRATGFPTVPVYDTLAACFAQLDHAPDIVAITTPSGTHFALALQAIGHGCHVLIEKPMTLDLAESRRLLAAAREHEVQVAVGHIYRFFPVVDPIRRGIARGDWGRVLQASVTVHWGHDQAYYDQATWRGTWASDGGVLMNQTVHALDLMLWLLGEPIVRASGTIARIAHQMEAEDYGAAHLTLASGAMLRVEGTTNTPEAAHWADFAIVTTEGTLQAGIRKGKPYFRFTDAHGKKKRPGYVRETLRELRSGPGLVKGVKGFLNPHAGIYFDLAQAITEGRPPRADGQAGHEAVEAILAIYRSAAEGGCPVELPLTDARLVDMEGFFPSI